MSYPYELDLVMGSEIDAVGGNIPLEIITSGAYKKSEEDQGEEISPVQGEVYKSNKLVCYKTISSDPEEIKHGKLYYVFNVTQVSEEGAIDNLKGVISRLNITITESHDSEYRYSMSSNMESIRSDLGLDADFWYLSFEGSSGTNYLEFSLYYGENFNYLNVDLYISGDTTRITDTSDISLLGEDEMSVTRTITFKDQKVIQEIVYVSQKRK